ncbi:MAG: homoserine kinase [Coriobacteriia bacterium]|nr:homoserine kinase [Coriobacteriia bacterium]
MAAVSVTVPATTANLGPGYDSFGLALKLYNRFSAQPASEWAVEIVGEGAGVLATDATNRVARAMSHVFSEAGEPERAAHVFSVNRIPPGQGLGSSAAAIVGGMLLADLMCDIPLGKDRIFEMAVELEGHPDNVAAALFGGFTMSWDDEGPRCVSVDPRRGIAVVAVVSELPLSTEEARAVLPDVVPHADAAFNAGRAGLLAAGLALGRGDLLGPGLSDRLHEPYRISAVPDLERVRAALVKAGAAGAALSGAGPTVVGFVDGHDDERALRAAEGVAERATELLADALGRRRPVVLPIDRRGAVLE